MGRKTNGYSEWKSEITYWAGLHRSVKGQFFGRDDELKKISDSLKRLNAVVLSGGPGIGKSKLAAEFANKSKRKAFWTPGGETPEQTLLSLAPHLGIERGDRSDDEILVQTRRRLQALPAKTLWVIDNLSDLNLLNTLLNEIGKISILVTSQDSRIVVPQGVGYIPIDVLGPEPATRLLCRSSNYDYRQPIFLEIVDEVGRLPRAVEALAVQLELPGETPETLLKELRGKANPLEFGRFQEQTAGLQIPRTDSLFNALRGPIDKLRPEIRDALAPLAYTADSPIPMPLAEALTGLSGGALINFFDECSGKSVLSAIGEQVTIHSLTAAAIAATNPHGSLLTALLRASSRLSAIIETRNLVPGGEMGHYEYMLACASVQLDPEERVIWKFSNDLANAYQFSGRFEDAASLHQENLVVVDRVLGPEHPDTLGTTNNLASALNLAGRFQEATKLHEVNLEVLMRVFGPEHPTTQATVNNLATAYESSGHFEEAVILHEKNLAVRQRVFGPEHPDTLATINNLGNAYARAQRFEDAISMYQENMETTERVLGFEHPETLISRNNLAAVFGDAERFEEAIIIIQENIEIMERVLGPEHPDTLNSRNNLAAAFRNVGRYDEAIVIHQDTLQIRLKVLGREHPSTLSSRNNLANAFGTAGLLEETAILHQENLEVRQRVLGNEHPDTLTSQINLATTYRLLGRDADADALLEQDRPL